MSRWWCSSRSRPSAGPAVSRNVKTASKAACCLAIAVYAATSFAQDKDPIQWVNPYIGTGSGPIGYGGTMPFVTPPFGMTDWTPQTRQNKLGVVSYNYDDPTISGFMGTHQPAIWMGDYGYLTVVPEIDTLKITPDERKLPFSHNDEIVSPDYYSVITDAGTAGKLHTEITATERCGYMRFTFPATGKPIVMIEASTPPTAKSPATTPRAPTPTSAP
jgi:putative alpha-1,2-mannosidase